MRTRPGERAQTQFSAHKWKRGWRLSGAALLTGSQGDGTTHWTTKVRNVKAAACTSTERHVTQHI